MIKIGPLLATIPSMALIGLASMPAAASTISCTGSGTLGFDCSDSVGGVTLHSSATPGLIPGTTVRGWRFDYSLLNAASDPITILQVSYDGVPIITRIPNVTQGLTYYLHDIHVSEFNPPTQTGVALIQFANGQQLLLGALIPTPLTLAATDCAREDLHCLGEGEQISDPFGFYSPEPQTALLLGLGLAGLHYRLRRRHCA